MPKLMFLFCEFYPANLVYLGLAPHVNFLLGAKLFIRAPLNVKKSCPKNKPVWDK